MKTYDVYVWFPALVRIRASSPEEAEEKAEGITIQDILDLNPEYTEQTPEETSAEDEPTDEEPDFK